jgi:hypothetical protein
MAIARGGGKHAGLDLVVSDMDATGSAVVSVITDFHSAEYPVVAWAATDFPETADVRLLWLSDYASAKVNTVQLTVVSGRLLPVSLAKNPAWLGRIRGLALLIKGPFEQPVRIQSVTIKPSGAVELLQDRMQEWLTFENWSGASINTIVGGADLQDLPLPTLLALAVALAIGAAFAFGARSSRFAAAVPATVAAVFFLAWLAFDARWMLNLQRQIALTAAQYKGKDQRERHLAMEDGPLFGFVERARTKMPATPVRVFIVADEHYFRGRGAYHLYPHNVYFDPWQNTVPPSTAMHKGDYLIVYYRRGMQYDASQQRMRWQGSPPIAAEALLVEPGAALFRIL